ncbi:MAG: antibiotic biosynthesis monooxygenase [Melioribacteraceae bacterium]|nr:antibiotic biosynthesis monooxygenase [Melioribacteraceae bacterium]
MSKVVFSISYEIFPEKRSEYLDVIRELKSIIKFDGLESYSVYEKKSKENSFTEIYTYESKEAWEEADESQNERVDILMTKLSDLVKEKSTHYTTLFEV